MANIKNPDATWICYSFGIILAIRFVGLPNNARLPDARTRCSVNLPMASAALLITTIGALVVKITYDL